MISPDDLSTLPIDEFAFPGPLRDALVGAILDERKTSTTSLVADHVHSSEPLPMVGERRLVIDSSGDPVCVTEVTEVRIVPLGDVDLAHALDEGEGFATVAEWRSGHENFWHSTDFREWLGDPQFTVTDATEAVLVRFRVTDRM